MKRGDVVIVDFARADPDADVRPALIVQSDRDNAGLQKTIVVQITSNLRRADEDANLLVNEDHPDWSQSGLELPSLVTCNNITNVVWDDVVDVIGSLSGLTMSQVDECLKAALDIP